MKDDGSMARLPDLLEFGRRHGIRVGTIKELIEYRRKYDARIWASTSRKIMSDYGPLERIAFKDGVGDDEHVVLVRGNPQAQTVAVYLDAREANRTWIDVSLADPQGELAEALFVQPEMDAAILLILNLHGDRAWSGPAVLNVAQLNDVYTHGGDVVSQILTRLQAKHAIFTDLDSVRGRMELAA
jgi:hypothetical protein